MIAPGVIEDALLRRAADAAGGDLRSVDVGELVGGIVDILSDGQGDCGVGDGFAQEPGYALLDWVLDHGGLLR